MKRLAVPFSLAFLAAGLAQAATVGVTGDISDDQGQEVAKLLLSEPVEVILVAGDSDNSKKTDLESFRKLYQGDLARIVPKVRPCPGNHDRYVEPPFSGYQAFWSSAAHAPEMYYSFDLDGWHVVSLDSYAFREGGKPAAAQLEWLKKDLAAHPGRPVLAYWHYPYYSRAKHGGDAKMRPFWEALFAHGPALVMNGHNHVYERYAPMDPDGRVVPETEGVREFELGPGGASPTKSFSKKEGPAPEASHAGSQHVGFFELEPDGAYRFTIQAVDGKGRASVVDSGAGRLSGPRK